MPPKAFFILLVAVLVCAALTILLAVQLGWTAGSLAIPIVLLLVLRGWLEIKRRSDGDAE